MAPSATALFDTRSVANDYVSKQKEAQTKLDAILFSDSEAASQSKNSSSSNFTFNARAAN